MDVRCLSGKLNTRNKNREMTTQRRRDSTLSSRRKRSDSENDMFTHEEFLSMLERRDKLYEEFDKKRECSESDKRCKDSDLDIISDSMWDDVSPENSPKLRKPGVRSPSIQQGRVSRSVLKEIMEVSTAAGGSNEQILGSPSDPIVFTLSDDPDTEADESSDPSLPKRKLPNANNETPKRSDNSSAGIAKIDNLPSEKRVPHFIAIRSHCLDENGFPLTQPALANLLEGVVAYVDVRSGADNRSSGVRDQLHKLGATTVQRYNSKVTHLLYSNGSQAVLRKAHERGIHIVSVLWIDACLRTGKWADEKLYKPFDLDKLLSPTARKLRRVRSMQPKTLEEDMAASERRMKRKQKREEKKQLNSGSVSADKIESPEKIKIETFMDKVVLPQLANWTPVDRSKNEDGDSSDDSYFEMKCTTPLAIRALMRINSPLIAARRAELGLTPLSKLAGSVTKSPSCHSIVSHTANEDGSSLKRKYSSASDVKNNGAKDEESDVGSLPQAKRPCIRRAGKKLFPNALPATVAEEVIVAVTPDEPNVHRKVHVSAEVETPISTKPLVNSQTHKLWHNAEVAKADQANTSSSLAPTTNSSSVSHGLHISQAAITADSSSMSRRSSLRSSCEETKNGQMTNKMESMPRKSLEDFVLPKLSKTKKQARITSYFTSSPNSEEAKLPTIVCTSLISHEYDQFCTVVRQLGGFRIVDKTDRSTTHVVCGNSRRTLNIVQGLVQGAWLLSVSWVKASAEAGKWLSEASYELEDYPIVKEYREIKARGDLVALFHKVGSIYVSPRSHVPQKDVISLIESGGGFVTKLARAADIVLGEVKLDEKHMNKTAIYADSKWVLDCIQNNTILPIENYITS